MEAENNGTLLVNDYACWSNWPTSFRYFQPTQSDLDNPSLVIKTAVQFIKLKNHANMKKNKIYVHL